MSPPAAALARAATPPDPAPVALEFAWEPFSSVARELAPLFIKHWQESGQHKEALPLDVDWDQYFALDAAGHVGVETVRDAGRLVGYVVILVHRSRLSASTWCATSDGFYLEPEFRGGWTAMKMFTGAMRKMREIGVTVSFLSAPEHYADGRIGLLFKRLGYDLTERVFSRVL